MEKRIKEEKFKVILPHQQNRIKHNSCKPSISLQQINKYKKFKTTCALVRFRGAWEMRKEKKGKEEKVTKQCNQGVQ